MNPPKPTALKVLAGNPGKRPLNASEPDSGVIDTRPPAELSDAAKAHWTRLAPMLAKSGVLKQSDRDLLFCYCETFAVWMESVQAGKLNVPMLTQVRQMLNEMGMTPAARTRIVVDKPAEQNDGKARFFG
ncbi:P27 family phage terminase small subunit [Propionivibrio sp.]|uniref:P27 family phage terminase small subunit n=1 Tax=Propionivibrio sp. TaxID=2212460 RepID=UPI00272DF5E5|nr:P27 family phage terminase small subunit [Propionivibrio sp.]